MMKKIYLLFVFAFSFSALFSQVLFTYGNASVDKEEFLRAYNKNKNPVSDKEKSLREYLDLYTKFKLKVKAAKELHLDTLQQLQYDLQNFRSQVDESYMNNEKEVSALVDEAFTRSQKDIHVIHFYADIDLKKNAGDSMNAYLSMLDLQSKLISGATNYEELAEEVSKKYTPIKTGDLGFITVFTVPYAYENIIYDLKPGEISTPYSTGNRIHMFKAIAERKSMGTWKVAQILLAFPPGEQAAFMPSMQKKADSIYGALLHEEDFAKMAALYSDDQLTALAGGEMPEFGSGKFDLSFESEVVKLKKDGDISKPFLTQYGLHIIKRLSQTPTPSDKNDASYLYSLKQKVLQDARIGAAKEKFAKEVLVRIGFKRNAAVKDADLFRYADSISTKITEASQINFPINEKTVFSFGKSAFKGKDWLTFVRNYKFNEDLYKGEGNPALLEKYITSAAIDYYKKHLEEYNPDFRYQMEEFKDGNILFEIMERNVWGNASSDSLGLQALYNKNKGNYLWAASANVILFSCNNKKNAEETIAALKNGKDWKKIIADGNNNIQADSGRYEITQLPLPEHVKAEAGVITDPVTNPIDGTVSFIKILKLYDAGLQRSFEEARGLVINDYQVILEEKWVNELKKKYPVKVNEAVFNSLLK